MKVKDKGKKKMEKKNQVLEKLTIQYVDVKKLRPNSYNPNRQSDHDFNLLLRSMREDGFTQPVLVQKQTNEIVDGEHRWRAAQALGFTEIPVVFVEQTTEQMRIATLRHNRARGNEEISLTAAVLRDLQNLGALDWAQDSLMMTDEEMNRFLEDIPVAESLAGDEYSQSWEPGETPLVEGNTRVVRDGQKIISITDTSANEIREREKKIKQARSEEERKKLRRESDVYRLNLIFSGQEANLVSKCLGSFPAEKLIKILREYDGRQKV